ncbi:MAG: hypothetical protein M3Z66_14990 [Chloroflexota bacterium]|nr:hypothetical protein [Chloroflexota bacterium]
MLWGNALAWSLPAVHAVVFLIGVIIVGKTLLSAVKTFVLPRGVTDPLTGLVFRLSRALFDLRGKRVQSFEERDQLMALYAPVTLLMLPLVWLAIVLVGYGGMFWSLGIASPAQAIATSGSSLLTLGFARLHTLAQTILAFSEAGIGLLLVALLIAYLPTMYSAWSRREAMVATLEVRAGSPPTVTEMILRFYRMGRLDRIADLWIPWETWFTDIEESHTSLAALTFFRSPQPDRSWVGAAGAILDTASFFSSTIDVPRNVDAQLCLRAGYIALRRIADFFGIQYNPNPQPSDGISISRQEWDEVVNQLAAAGVPIKADRDQAWRDFEGWRVNYDTVLLALARLTMAPYAPWVSDRSLRMERTT